MSTVGFWTPVTYGPFESPFPHALLGLAEDYFCLDGKKMVVTRIEEDISGIKEWVNPYQEEFSLYKTAFKIISYVAALGSLYKVIQKRSFTVPTAIALAIPLIAFVNKLVFRSSHQFVVDIQERPLYLGEEEVVVSPLEKTPLEFDKLYSLTPRQMAQLKIGYYWITRGHNLPQISNDVYTVPPVYNRGYSELSEYKGSTFEFEFRKEGSYNVIRRHNIAKTKASTMSLTVQQVIDLKIVPVAPDAERWYSMRPQLQDFSFTGIRNVKPVRTSDGNFFYEKDNSYTMTIAPIHRNYKFLPFNQAVTIEGDDCRSLMLRPVTENTDLEPGVTWWVHSSELDEYMNSVILTKEIEGKYIAVRMLKSTKNLS